MARRVLGGSTEYSEDEPTEGDQRTVFPASLTGWWFRKRLENSLSLPPEEVNDSPSCNGYYNTSPKPAHIVSRPLFHTFEYFFLHPTQMQQCGVSDDFDHLPLFRQHLRGNIFRKDDVPLSSVIMTPWRGISWTS